MAIRHNLPGIPFALLDLVNDLRDALPLFRYILWQDTKVASWGSRSGLGRNWYICFDFFQKSLLRIDAVSITTIQKCVHRILELHIPLLNQLHHLLLAVDR